jgi:UDP-2,3-diacylglucosamine hydrolase
LSVQGWRKLGLIAGGGELPVLLAEHCAASGQPYFVARVAPFADAPELERHPGAAHGLGAMGARMAALRDAGCDAVVMIGRVPRVDFRVLEWDEGGRAMLPALAAAAPLGDDALLRALLQEHEKHGFRMIGADEAMADLLASPGAWTAREPGPHMPDLAHAARIAGAIGAMDIGQGAVVCTGLVLAVEAQEGTNAMLARVAGLPATVRGAPEARRGVLVKRPKPIQERRIDLPVIGVATIEAAAAAGLAGVGVEADGVLVARRAEVIAAADAAGLFVYGFTASEVGDV